MMCGRRVCPRKAERQHGQGWEPWLPAQSWVHPTYQLQEPDQQVTELRLSAILPAEGDHSNAPRGRAQG